MDTIDRQRLRELSAHEQEPSLSLYMPTHRTGRELQQDPIRLKGLIRQAHEELDKRDIDKSVADQMLKPLSGLLNDHEYWQHSSDGLAAFCSPDGTEIMRLPQSFEESVHVGNRFVIKPLLPLLGRNGRLVVLALTQESARLYDTFSSGHEEIELPEIRKIEVDGDEQSLQFHTYAAGRPSGQTDVAMYHGHGGPDDRAEADITNFFQQVDKAVENALADAHVPMILACVDYLAPMYRKASSHKRLLETTIGGSPDRWKLAELCQEARQAAAPVLREQQEQSLEKFQSASDAEHRATEIQQVALAASQGRIDALFLQENADCCGKVDLSANEVQVAQEPTNGSIDLLDYAASETIRHGGDVFTLEKIPDVDSPMAALLRF